MTDTEVTQMITRLQNEQKLATLQAETNSKGQGIASTVFKEVIKPVAVDVGKSVASDLLSSISKKALGLDKEDVVDATDELIKELKKEADISKYRADIVNNKKKQLTAEDDLDQRAKRIKKEQEEAAAAQKEQEKKAKAAQKARERRAAAKQKTQQTIDYLSTSNSSRTWNIDQGVEFDKKKKSKR